MKATTFLMWVMLFVPFVAFQAVVGLTTETKKEKAPEFVLTTLDNKKISLSDFRGRPILLKFIASWWLECRQEAPVLAKVYEKANAKGVEFIGIFIKDTEQNAKEFVAQYRFTFPTGLDSEAKLTAEYKVFGPPVKFFISKKGQIIERVSGPMKEDDLVQIIERLTNWYGLRWINAVPFNSASGTILRDLLTGWSARPQSHYGKLWMAYVIYQDHTIVSSAVYDQVSGKWMSDAYITFDENGSLPQLYLIPTSPELFSRFEDAETAGMESAKNWVDLAKQGTQLMVRSSSGCAEKRDRREECMPPMTTSEYRPNIKLQEAILHATSVGYKLRKTTRESRKNIDHSRRLMKETKVILDQSRLIILHSQRLIFKG